MNRSTRVLLSCAGLIGMVGVAGCGGDSTGPSSTADISGNWQLSATINNASLQVTCQAAGDAQISQSGKNFTGQVSGSTEVCDGPGGTLTGDVDGALTGGQVSGNTATYSDGTCNYTGSISGSPTPNLVKGNVTCTIPYQGQNYPFTGTWQISR
jgi:hypothetical protein